MSNPSYRSDQSDSPEPLAVQELRDRNHAAEMDINRSAARRWAARQFAREQAVLRALCVSAVKGTSQ